MRGGRRAAAAHPSHADATRCWMALGVGHRARRQGATTAVKEGSEDSAANLCTDKLANVPRANVRHCRGALTTLDHRNVAAFTYVTLCRNHWQAATERRLAVIDQTVLATAARARRNTTRGKGIGLRRVGGNRCRRK